MFQKPKKQPLWLSSILTPGERRALLLIITLFIIGLIVRWLRSAGYLFNPS